MLIKLFPKQHYNPDRVLSLVVDGKCDKHKVTVMARDNTHLERLITVMRKYHNIEEDITFDFPYWIVVQKPVFQELLNKLVSQIDYSNLKSAVSDGTDYKYFNFLYNIWSEGARCMQVT